MRTFVQQQTQAHRLAPPHFIRPGGLGWSPQHGMGLAYQRRARRNQPAPAPLPWQTGAGFDFGRTALHAPSPAGERQEQEAERIARQVASGPPVGRSDQVAPSDPAIQPRHEGQVVSSSGHPLDPTTRRWMEQRFGRDFGQVRVHTGGQAAAAAGRLNALAYTFGREIVFGAGQYAPNTRAGRRLLAHELAHVRQQAGKPPIVQRQAAPAITPASEQDRRSFVQDTIDFLNRSAEFFGDERVRLDQALFERLINNWYLIVIERERMIDSDLQGDPLLKRGLRAAYTAAIRVLISRAATLFNRSEETLYRENSGRIPMWAWPTPHRLEPGFSTPLAEGRGVDILTGNVAFSTNGFDVTIVPDAVDPGLGDSAETRIEINWQLPAYRWQMQRGRRVVTDFDPPPRPTVRIQTFYGRGVTAASQSGYGRGTTPEDIAGGRVTPRSTTLGFHEGSHGLAFIAFLEANPAPQFTGRVGMSEAEFVAARNQWASDLRAYSQRIRDESTRLVDCVGTTIDQYHQARAGAGGVVRIRCAP